MAGAGAYDLAGPMARKTGEAATGIRRLLSAEGPPPALAAPLVAAVRALDPAGRRYPGSPELARSRLRPGDRLVLVELHPSDHADLDLEARYAGCEGVEVRREDGLRLLARSLPPPGRRALVLIDPAYELEREETVLVAALGRALARQPSAVYLLWYPVLERARTEAFLAALAEAGLGRALRVELGRLPDGAARGLTASGMVIANAPRGLDRWFARELPILAAVLGAEGACRVERLPGRPAPRRPRSPVPALVSGAQR
ncbi:MAG: ribosomal RNA large subunit methyltransferase J [Geminicoccaceae bacterium]|jgi:23S rRNA (adenine2030-N6)-methyltransferase|nr:MAG: ribosomal RNA large subunit methyltransferase J [Geminicoccaceae bacterium]